MRILTLVMPAARFRFLVVVLAIAVAALLPTAAEAQCVSTQSCIAVHSGGGCDSQACCTSVCAADPTCCFSSWDAGCVALANISCAGYCGSAASGSCYAPHANPACDTASCCNAVCAIDAFCCQTTWDLTCVQYAGFACPGTPGTCGQASGDCYTTHSQGACNDATCCTAVCTIDPTCCESAWDFFCVYAAEQTCVSGCFPSPDDNAVAEIEDCDQRTNDPCYGTTGGAPETMTANIQISGRLGRPPSSINGPDVDVYRVIVPDTDGDGIAKVQLTFASSPQAWAALVADSNCAPIASSLAHVSTSLCVEVGSTPTCVPAGAYRIVVSGGAYPQLGGGDISCLSANRYNVKLIVTQSCVACAPNGPSCFVPHTTGGCRTATCCAAVCSNDPFCCDSTWDTGCVASSAALCVTSVPANDLCANAIAVAVGDTPFNTMRSGNELGALAAPCAPAGYARDVWFAYTANVSGVIDIGTCGSWYDTLIGVYTGSCGALTQIACNDNGTICAGNSASRLSIVAECGVRYLIRVGPKFNKGSDSLQGGDTVLHIGVGQVVPCAPACPADLNHSGGVDAQDITILLNGWGSSSGDINGDGTTNALDVAALLNAWGPCL